MPLIQEVEWAELTIEEVVDSLLAQLKEVQREISPPEPEDEEPRWVIKAHPMDIQERLMPLVETIKQAREDIDFHFVHPLGGNEGSLTIELKG